MGRSARALLPMLALLAPIAGCGGGSGTATEASAEPGPPAQSQTLPPDEDIVAKVYDSDYSVPADFFVDERAGMARSYTLHHVLDDSGAFELCSDDFETASAWEDADNASRSVSGYYVGAYENDRYFEFIRELSYDDDVGNIGDLTSPGFARVFKCAHLSRDGVDRSLLEGFAGHINARPLDDERLRVFAEYFWQFTFFPARHRKVLSSGPSPAASGPRHTMLLAFAITQGTGRCDRIEVVEWSFAADAATGAVSSAFTTVRAFEAELAGGSPRLCR